MKKIFRDDIDRALENFHYDINALTNAEEKTQLTNELKSQFESYWKSQIDKFRDVASMVPQPAQQAQQGEQSPPQQHMPQPGGGHQGGGGGGSNSNGNSGGGSASAPPPRRSSRRRSSSSKISSRDMRTIEKLCKRQAGSNSEDYEKCVESKKRRAIRKKKEAEKKKKRSRGRH